MKKTLWALAASALMALAGCGGTGAGAGGKAEGALTASAAASISVGVRSPTIGSDGADKVTVVATVKNANNVALAGQPVVFSTTDTGAVLSVDSATTDGTGTAQATLGITDPTNREIVVKAASGAVTGSVTVRVAGSLLTLSGATSISYGGSSTYVVTLKNSSSAAVSGATVALQSKEGNGVAPLSATSNVTDSTGQAKFTVTGSVAGNDTLTAWAQGISQSQNVSVSGNVALLEAPLAEAEVLVNTPQAVTARFTQDGVPLAAGSVIQFAATRGSLTPVSATTDGDGVATVNITSASAGLSTVSAMAPDGTNAAVEFEFVSRTPAAVQLQASPTTVPVNLSGSSTSAAQLLARVRDATGNPVKGVRVNFSADSDPSNGHITPPYALTDSSGVASTSFVAGPNSSGHNLVVVRASIPSTVHTHTAKLTVAAQALSVRIHTGNTLETPDPQTYLLPYAAVVSDAAGNPVAGAAVAVSYVPTYFFKGQYVDVSGGWEVNDAASCVTEDGNGNGFLDGIGTATSEDLNGNGVLDPGNVATSFVRTEGGKTDASGFAALAVKYPRGYANWVAILLQVTITAPSGSETVTSTSIRLPALAGDLSSTANSPPGGTDSRFGIAGDCTSAD